MRHNLVSWWNVVLVGAVLLGFLIAFRGEKVDP